MKTPSTSMRLPVRLLSLAAAAMWAAQAQAAFTMVDLAGFQSAGASGSPSNSQVILSIEPGATVTGWDFLALSFSTSGDSYLNEFVISVNNSDSSQYMDAIPSDTDAGGSFGPASGSWGSALGGSVGAPFTVADGMLVVTVYELFTDPGTNATVSAGSLRIDFTSPIPEPASYGLMGLGLLGLAAARYRRRSA